MFQAFLAGLWRLLTFLVVDIWPITLVMVLGATGIYLLLPRPRNYPTLWGALPGTAALVLAGVFLVHGGVLSAEILLFYGFSGVAIVAGVLLITQHNPARAALSFALVILATCGLFLLLAAPFLMAATIIIYAGAIIVTFLFVIMLAQQTGLDDADLRSREPLLAAVTGFVLLAALLYVLRLDFDTRDLDAVVETIHTVQAQPDEKARLREAGEVRSKLVTALTARHFKDLTDLMENEVQFPETFTATFTAKELSEQLDKLDELAKTARNRVGLIQAPRLDADTLPLSGFSGPPLVLQYRGDPTGREIRRDSDGRPAVPAENSTYLGRSLFTDYLLPVELGGLLLLVATVGAIVITHRRPQKERPA